MRTYGSTYEGDYDLEKSLLFRCDDSRHTNVVLYGSVGAHCVKTSRPLHTVEKIKKIMHSYNEISIVTFRLGGKGNKTTKSFLPIYFPSNKRPRIPSEYTISESPTAAASLGE